jgi:predicted nucleotidyltransferase
MAVKHDDRTLVLDVVERIRRGYGPERIVLFGSYATGTAGPDSDIDLLIVKKTRARPIDRRVEVAQAAAGSHRRVPLEPIVLTPEEVEARLRAGDQFIQWILEHGEVLYAAG